MQRKRSQHASADQVCIPVFQAIEAFLEANGGSNRIENYEIEIDGAQSSAE
jgi:hypothetical protein